MVHKNLEYKNKTISKYISLTWAFDLIIQFPVNYHLKLDLYLKEQCHPRLIVGML